MISDNYAIAIDRLPKERCREILSFMNKHKMYLNMRGVTVESFKNALKKKVKYYLSKYVKNSGRAASLWFDEKEENERFEKRKKNITLKDPPWIKEKLGIE